MRKILVWSLILGIGLMICACGLQPVAEPESATAAVAGQETEAREEVTEKATETTAATQATQATTETIQATESTTETIHATETVTETTQATVPETTAVPQMRDWRTAYLEFLENEKDYFRAFALVYIDGDGVPELYLNGISEATGDVICAYKNGQVIEEWLRRTWGGSYIPGTGLIKNTNGNMGYYTTHIYRLTGSGFTEIWSGHEEQKDIPSANGNGEVTFASTFFIGDRTVSEAEYYAAIEAVFNTSQAVPLHGNAVSYDAIRQLILES